jgi:hypothetical protein
VDASCPAEAAAWLDGAGDRAVAVGHTTPIITFPIGGTVEVRADRAAPRLTITSH